MLAPPAPSILAARNRLCAHLLIRRPRSCVHTQSRLQPRSWPDLSAWLEGVERRSDERSCTDLWTKPEVTCRIRPLVGPGRAGLGQNYIGHDEGPGVSYTMSASNRSRTCMLRDLLTTTQVAAGRLAQNIRAGRVGRPAVYDTWETDRIYACSFSWKVQPCC